MGMLSIGAMHALSQMAYRPRLDLDQLDLELIRSDRRGRWVVLFVLWRDDTPELRGIRRRRLSSARALARELRGHVMHWRSRDWLPARPVTRVRVSQAGPGLTWIQDYIA